MQDGKGVTVKPKMLCRSVLHNAHTLEKMAEFFLLISRLEKMENSSRILLIPLKDLRLVLVNRRMLSTYIHKSHNFLDYGKME